MRQGLMLLILSTYLLSRIPNNRSRQPGEIKFQIYSRFSIVVRRFGQAGKYLYVIWLRIRPCILTRPSTRALYPVESIKTVNKVCNGSGIRAQLLLVVFIGHSILASGFQTDALKDF
jgi:hypothetical protein